MSSRKAPPGKKKSRAADLEADFGPGMAAKAAAKAEPKAKSNETTGPAARHPGGPIPGLACAGEDCVLKPAADLFGRFALGLARGHAGSLSRAAFSAIGLMKAFRDFLDEEIALAERAAGHGEKSGSRYVKISVE